MTNKEKLGRSGELLPHEREYWSAFVTHDPDACAGNHCPVHNPSNHTMRYWPLNYRTDRGITERICRCGVGHPDPDCQRAQKDSTHGCCGCCTNPNYYK